MMQQLNIIDLDYIMNDLIKGTGADIKMFSNSESILEEDFDEYDRLDTIKEKLLEYADGLGDVSKRLRLALER